ncbi:MAG: tetratricopeptide repeat protein [Acidobacteriota bacterium]
MEFLNNAGKIAVGLVLLVGWKTAFLAAQEGDYPKGLSYYKQQQYEKAIGEFKAIVKAHPDYESGYRILGDSYLKIKEYDHAVEAFQNAVRLKKDNYASHYGLALAHFNAGRYAEAIPALQEGERYARSPRHQYQLYRTRGSAHYNLGNFERAIADLGKATAIQRGNPKDALQLGISYYKLKNYAEAERLLEQALGLDPDAVAAAEYLALLRYRKGTEAIQDQDYARAVELLRDYVDQNPGDGEASFNLGLALLFSNNRAEAEREFLKTATLMPDRWEAYDRLGYIYELTGRYSSSLENYQKALDLHPDSSIEESLERMRERIRRSE